MPQKKESVSNLEISKQSLLPLRFLARATNAHSSPPTGLDAERPSNAVTKKQKEKRAKRKAGCFERLDLEHNVCERGERERDTAAS
jgi:hypothetical protein